LFQRIRATLIFATVAALLVLTHPATARASGCACFFVHVNSSYGYVSYLNDTAPFPTNALLFTTVNGSGGVPVDTSAQGVWDNTAAGQWTIYNEDGSLIPLNAQFNVYAALPYQSSWRADYTHVTTTSNTGGDSTVLNVAVLNGNPNAVIKVSAAYTINNQVYDTHQLGVWYSTIGQRWEIFHEDKSPMPVGAAYFVEAINTSFAPYYGTVSADATNLQNGQVVLNNTLLNNHPNDPNIAIQITQDWGTNGVYNNHPIGVTYNTSTNMWAIYNVDGTPIPSGAMFFYDAR